ncbi:MAG TPA: hypothetical protein VMW85_00490 [Methanomassiliicoccales archaeon]|nr:hypothetical protein [Methanomassiliicoccales archaeon]
MSEPWFRLPSISHTVPDVFRRMYPVKVSPGTLDLIRREGYRLDDYVLRTFNLMLWCLGTMIPLGMLMVVVLPYPFSLVAISPMILPFIFPAYRLSLPGRHYLTEQRTFLLDSPAVIGAMTMSMNRSPSLERALEVGSRSGSGALQASLARMVWKALTGEVQDLRRGLSAWTATLDGVNEGLRRSLHLILAAEDESAEEGRDRLLDQANSLVLDNLREACERYVGSLSFPVMLVFAFGVLAPVMLFSLIPMIGLGSSLPTDGGVMNTISLAIVLLVLVPTVTLLYVRAMLGRNPLSRNENGMFTVRRRTVAMALVAVSVATTGIVAFGSITASILVGLCIALFALYSNGGGKNEKADKGHTRSFIDGLYRLGNAMMGGQDLEASFHDVVLMEEGAFSEWGLRMLHATRTGRISLIQSLKDDRYLRERSPELHQSYLTVMECAKEDHQGAGKVAINLAQCQNDMDRTKRHIRENLRSVVEMMNSTSLFFAPAIIGLTSGIMGMMGGEKECIMAVASIYVVQLALLVNYFTSNLDGYDGRGECLRTYAVRGYVALLMFLTASLCGQTFLFHLL